MSATTKSLFIEHLSLLKRAKWFAELPSRYQKQLLDKGALIELDADSVLFLRGDANCGIYCVLEGAIHISGLSVANKKITLDFMESPEWFGEISCIDHGVRSHDAHAQGPSKLIHISPSAIDELVEAEPIWWKFFAQLLASKMRLMMTSIENRSSLPTLALVASQLLAMSERPGVLAEGMANRMISINQEQLGVMLSLSRQTISTILAEFASRGWIKRHYGSIELIDCNALAALSQEPTRVKAKILRKS